MATVPPRVVELVETFERNIEAYKNQQYNEAQLRREFIDPFFEELGWDITNKGGLAQAYKDVIHEDAIKIGGYTKAPDYCFRIGGTRKFFLEAKKPSIDIKGDPNPAYQLRRYAWSSKLPLSILTDFEEFAVYDCQTRPKLTDKATTARIMYFTYKEYIDHWYDIESVFSKDAIQKGSFDKFAASTRAKRGTTTVDIEFLKEIEEWRKMLARTITLLNIKLSKHEINFAVQRTIDRILFLRMCEDRGIERYQQLLGVTNGRQIYPRLCQVFKQADAKYNSGLFHFSKEPGRAEEPDELTLNLVVDDTPVSWIIRSLYYPKCPYEFSVLPAEILGNVYEQFLGKVIRITPGHRAVIEEKPEVKKAGGIYYTPAYIVDYIVKNTVGKLCENKTPTQISKLKILDPACGSGSFLLSAYTCLLNHHRDWYVDNNPAKYTKQIYQGKGGQWFLTIAEKKKILLNNIFGVDIDTQAVEVTKLSLLLKVLEGETSETIGQTYQIFHERALPDLGNNIKCGNSLIGPDFFENKDPDSIDPEEYRRINPFNWKTEFPQIFSGKNPGFHAVIGNPPYVRVDVLENIQKKHLKTKYASAQGKYDLYYLFVELANKLVKEEGWFAYIIPNRFCTSTSGETLRNIIVGERNNVKINSVSQLRVFGKVANYPVITIVNKASKKGVSPKIKLCRTSKENELDSPKTIELSRKNWTRLPLHLFPINAEKDIIKLTLKLIQRCEILKDKIVISEGFRIPEAKETNEGNHHIVKQYQFSRYSDVERGRFLKTAIRQSIISDSSERYKHCLEPKIVFAEDALRIEATLELNKSICQGGVYFGTLKKVDKNSESLKYLLGLLNSRLLTVIYAALYAGMHMGGGYMRFRTSFLNTLPIRTIDFDNPDDKDRHDKMVKLVDRILDLHKRLAKAKVPTDKTRIQRQINTTDKQIDNLVYELYNLTPEEIKIVEDTD